MKYLIIGNLFSLPFLVNIYQTQTGDTSLDYVYMAGAIVPMIIGAFAAIRKKGEKSKVTSGDKITIFSYGAVIAILAYAIGKIKLGFHGTLIISVLGSFMSVDLLNGLAKSMVQISSNLKDNWDSYWGSKNNKDEDDNFPDDANPV